MWSDMNLGTSIMGKKIYEWITAVLASSLSLFVANQLSILEHAKLQLFMHPNIGGVRRRNF